MTFADALRHEDTATLSRAYDQLATVQLDEDDPATQTRVAVLIELDRRERAARWREWVKASFGG